MDRPQVLLREARSIPLYRPAWGQVCDDPHARYAADSRSENEFAESVKQYGGHSQRVKLK